MKYFIVIVFVMALLLPVTGCGTSGGKTAPESSAYWPTHGWQVSTPEEQGMDSELLAGALDFLQEQDYYEVHSLLVIRNGYIVTDAYFYPFAEGIMHNIFSVTKSFMATLVGIALDQGYIESVGQPVLGFFPETEVANIGEQSS